jgi:hypothetical protein
MIHGLRPGFLSEPPGSDTTSTPRASSTAPANPPSKQTYEQTEILRRLDEIFKITSVPHRHETIKHEIAAALQAKDEQNKQLLERIAFLENKLDTRLDAISQQLNTITAPPSAPSCAPNTTILPRQHTHAKPYGNVPKPPKTQEKLFSITLKQPTKQEPVLSGLEYPQLLALAQESVNKIHPSITIRSALKLRSNDIRILCNSEKDHKLLMSDKSWITALHAQLRLATPEYSVIAHSIPSTYNPTDQSFIDMLTKRNNLSSSAIKSCLWAKTPTKSHGSVIIRCTTPFAAQKLITNQLATDFSPLLRVEKCHRKLRQCTNCFGFHHLAYSCRSASARCKTCSEKHHSSTCKHDGPPTCINCKGDHPADSFDCPTRVKRQQEIERQDQFQFFSSPMACSEFPPLSSQ